MANTYTWNVGQCDRTLSDGMITTLHYTVSAVTEDGVYSAGAYGSVGLEAAEADSMIAYDKVTEEQAVIWVKAAIGGDDKVAEIHAALDAQLTEKRTPTTGAGTPWSA
tara:strand:+ start:136 stop:459 length:324 start_codon:yes stop_codon:yes gene_type:complete